MKQPVPYPPRLVMQRCQRRELSLPVLVDRHSWGVLKHIGGDVGPRYYKSEKYRLSLVHCLDWTEGIT